MGRAIPIQLQEALDSGASTLTMLLKVTPVRPGFSSYGVTLTNRDIRYDDGEGLIVYSASIGMVPSNLLATPNLSVDNADFQHLVPEFDVPISEADIRAGVYDYAEFTLMLVDYENLAAGHVVVHHGNLGQLRVKDGLSYWNELFGLSKQLKQSVCARYSRTCPATFGSQPPGTPGATVTEEKYCGFDAESLWEAFEVTSVGDEPTVEFTDSALPFDSDGPVADIYHRGMVRWETGLNAGREYEVEGNTTGGTVSTMFAMDYPAQVGDAGLIRRGCNKIARDDARGCKHWFGTQWTIHFRGQPDIPLGDALANVAPGGNAGPGDFGGDTSGVNDSVEEA